MRVDKVEIEAAEVEAPGEARSLPPLLARRLDYRAGLPLGGVNTTPDDDALFRVVIDLFVEPPVLAAAAMMIQRR